MSISLHEFNADLHAHSTVSDGTLAPRELVARAHGNRVDLFALTDHDEVGGLAEARAAAAELNLPFVAGVEVSVTWAGQTVHVVGLGIDPGHRGLNEGLAQVRSGRLQRAHEMAAQLAVAGIEGAFDGALAFAGNADLISRTHFARYLVATGICHDVREVFKHYLIEGRPGFVPHRWARLADAVGWINGAGGVAVMAHPGRYKYDALQFTTLFGEFKDAGGMAIEVATSNHAAHEVRHFSQLAAEFGFEASRGSDFHSPADADVEIGRAPAMPQRLMPVWHRFV
jgi:predicted metal-dependent phosphoesterase TrpH